MNKLSRLGPVLLLPPAQFKRPRCSVYWIQFCCYLQHSSNGHVVQYTGFSSVATARTVQTATLFSILDSVLLLPPAQFKRPRCSVYWIQFCCYRPHSSNGHVVQYTGFSSVATARTVQTATLVSISDSVLLLPPAQFKRPRCSVYWIQFCCYRPHSSNGHVGQYTGFSSVATARTVQTATLVSISDSVLLLPPAQFKRPRCSVYRIQFCCYLPHSSNGHVVQYIGFSSVATARTVQTGISNTY